MDGKRAAPPAPSLSSLATAPCTCTPCVGRSSRSSAATRSHMPPPPRHCVSFLQVKTDIEYATLYAALLLRLRNPDDGDFALTWSLKEGSYLTSHVGGETATDSSA